MTYCSYCMTPIKDTYKVCPYCGKGIHAEVPAHHLLPGTVLNGKFLVGSALGEGGFGITYIGRDLNLDIKVAIKEFFPNGYVNRANAVSSDITCSISGDRQDFFVKGKERFLQEARILAKFATESGVVEVRDFFEENRTAYIIMEYVEGQDLKQYLKANGPMSPGKTIELLMPVMKTLTKIHAQGLIHRDISPDNIRMSHSGTKLLDFGAARNVAEGANKSLSVMLKPGYAPEEQYRSRGNQGPWTDVYALCATIYMCITGITPDDATQRVFNDELKRPSALGVAIDRNVEDALMKGMAVLQKDRYQSVNELIDGLMGKYVPAPAPVPTPAPAPTPTPTPAPVAPAYTAAKKKGSGGKWLIGVIVTLLVIGGIAGGVYYLWYNGYFDDFLYDGDASSKDKDTGGTVSSTDPAQPDEPSLSEAEMIAQAYAETYFEADYTESDGYCAVEVSDIIEYQAAAAGLSLSEYLSDEYGVSTMRELYALIDEQDYESFVQTYGEDYTYSVSVLSSERYDDDAYSALCQEIDSYYTENYPDSRFIDVSAIEGACEVNIEYTLSGSVGSETLNTDVVLIYLDGEWRVLD